MAIRIDLPSQNPVILLAQTTKVADVEAFLFAIRSKNSCHSLKPVGA